MKRYYIIFKGRVQGVGFRYTLMMYAKEMKITGWVKNLYNGDVETEAQGELVDDFISRVLNTKGFIRIDDYAIKKIEVVNNEKEFIVTY